MSERTAIAGVPRAGKSTLADKMGGGHSTDELIDLGWSEASLEASYWFDEPGPWVVEGMAVPRALRKWLGRNPTGKPCDRLIWLGDPYEKQVPGQAAMGVGAVTVMREIMPEMRRRGVVLVGCP
jgi:hypothetical protein